MNRLSWLLLAGLSAGLAAEDDPFGDTFEEGFGEVDTETPAADSDIYVATRLFHRGQLNTQHDAPVAGATDHRGLSSFAFGLQPRLEWRPTDRFDAVLDVGLSRDWVFDLKDGADWTDAYRDQREFRVEWDEVLVRYQTGDWAVSTGRQVLTWGFNDALSIQEVVNAPRLSQPGLYEPEETRQARWLSEARLYLGGWTLQGVVAHENRMAEQPVHGSDFYPFAAELDDRTPAHGWDDPANHAGGARLSGLWRGVDLAAFGWTGYNPTGHQLFEPDGVRREYERLTTLGAGLSVPISDSVLKAELTHEQGLTYAPVGMQTVNGQPNRVSGDTQETERWSAAVGLDISLPKDTRLLIEYQLRHLPDYAEAMATNLGDETQVRWALGLEHTTWRDQLTLSGAALGFGDDFDGGQITRVKADWAINDQWRTELGYVAYLEGDTRLLDQARDNDRLYWQIDYFF